MNQFGTSKEPFGGPTYSPRNGHLPGARFRWKPQDYWQTIQLCQQAIDIVADRGVLHLLGLAQAQNSKWRLDAERNLKITAKLDPWSPDYFVVLGERHQKAGMRLKAQRMFEQAKSLDAG